MCLIQIYRHHQGHLKLLATACITSTVAQADILHVFNEYI